MAALIGKAQEGANPPERTKGTAWDQGVVLFEQGRHGEALAMLLSVVAHSPGDLARRQTLRQMERRLRQENPVPEAELLLAEVWWEIRQAKHGRQDPLVEWDQVDQAAERGLAIDPWDVELHIELGHACLARGYRDVARFAFACALEFAPERRDLQELAAQLAEDAPLG